MPPPHLHPRSRMTSSLFATTVLASFFVVALPHVLPCPAPRGARADDGEESVPPSDGAEAARRRRPRLRRRSEAAEVRDGIVQFDGGGGGGGDSGGMIEDGEDDARKSRRRMKRECPVPKPGGVVGELLGFQKPNDDEKPRSRPDR